MIISLYAGGMTVRDIQHHMITAMGVDISHETISAITDAVLDEVMIWQNRQLDDFYPVIFLDALRIKVRDGAGSSTNPPTWPPVGSRMSSLSAAMGLKACRRQWRPPGRIPWSRPVSCT